MLKDNSYRTCFMKKDSNLFNFAFVTINALLLGLGSLCLGLRSIFSAGVLAGWDKGQLLIFSSYTFGLFTLIALVLGSIFLAYPLLRKNKKTSLWNYDFSRLDISDLPGCRRFYLSFVPHTFEFCNDSNDIPRRRKNRFVFSSDDI